MKSRMPHLLLSLCLALLLSGCAGMFATPQPLTSDSADSARTTFFMDSSGSWEGGISAIYG